MLSRAQKVGRGKGHECIKNEMVNSLKVRSGLRAGPGRLQSPPLAGKNVGIGEEEEAAQA